MVVLWMFLQAVLLLPAALSAEASSSIELKLPQAGRTGFTLLGPAATSLTFTNILDAEAGAE